jgi:hypothetical protein
MTVSPAFGRPIWVRPAYAVKPGMPRTPSAVVTGALPGSSLRTVEPFCTPYFCHPVYGVQLWMPEAGGWVDYASEHDERAMTVLGLSSKREITRTSIRVRTAMAAQTREQGRYLGGRPPYGYRLADAGPHPNKAHAAWGPALTGWSPIRRRRMSCGGFSRSGSRTIRWRGSRGR